jgi:hypothetical protein
MSPRGRQPSRSERRPLRVWMLAICASLAAAAALRPAAAQDAPGSREYEIKAAFIYNFTKFVEWPAAALVPGAEPIVIGVLGDSPCAQALEELTRGRKVNGHPILVKRVESAQEAGSAHVLFVGAAHEAQFVRLEPALAKAPVLTVGEAASFATDGGMINFLMQGDKVRFEVNVDSAERAGVKISAQLLKLAAAVRRSG